MTDESDPFQQDEDVLPEQNFAGLRADVRHLQSDVRSLKNRSEEIHAGLSDAILIQGNDFTRALSEQRKDFMLALQNVTKASVEALRDATVRAAVRTFKAIFLYFVGIVITSGLTYWLTHYIEANAGK